MKLLPDEIILHIISYLEPPELVNLQNVSRQFLRLSRDNTLWKQLCFEHSAAERRRRRHEMVADMDPRLLELIRAADTLAGTFSMAVQNPTAPSADGQAPQNIPRRNAALLANWDPSYPEEKVNWYQDFIQRHAPHRISWFQDAKHGHEDDNLHHEATGAGILYDQDGFADKLVAPLEDGSISIWDASGSHGRRGRIIARASMGLLTNKGSDLDYDTRLTQSQAMMTETGAVECVSIDSRQNKAFFAVQNVLNEVDLNTLKIVSRTPYPFPITALSEARYPTPLTVGTNWTLHLHDTRTKPSLPASTRCELIGGAATPNSFSPRLETGDFGGHVSLSQPGALSILHLPTSRDGDGDANADIWVAGRFTSFLHFDRRSFPRLRGTVHSGARISCLAALPHPFVSRELRGAGAEPGALYEAKSAPGWTLVAAGEYKGKGSLELYGLERNGSSTATTTTMTTAVRDPRKCFQNRQTASRSKLLAVAPHGTRIVVSDGEGNLKWVERDGSAAVRSLNINEEGRAHDEVGQPPMEAGWGDMVKKILPMRKGGDSSREVPLGKDDLVVWTGDGKLGTVGFGT
ncbi:hypothetical protein BS50DRAFT_515450, partial [Corynespora cassiicola Philippines]